MKFHRKFTALALAMVSTVLLVAVVVGAVSASAQPRTSRSTSTFVYTIHIPPGKVFSVRYQSGVDRIDSSDLVARSETSGAISRAVFAGDDFLIQSAIHTRRFSGDLTQTLLVQGATVVGVAHVPIASHVTLTNKKTGTTITLKEGEHRFSIHTG